MDNYEIFIHNTRKGTFMKIELFFDRKAVPQAQVALDFVTVAFRDAGFGVSNESVETLRQDWYCARRVNDELEPDDLARVLSPLLAAHNLAVTGRWAGPGNVQYTISNKLPVVDAAAPPPVTPA